MKLANVALATGLLPILTVHTTYIIAATQGHVDWCLPYLDSCTSISATGRKSPEAHVFKGLMIPSAMLMMLFWLLCRQWLAKLGHRPGAWLQAIPAIGCTGALFLILYTTMLGVDGDLYRLQRRIGVIIYFTFSYLAQLLLLRSIVELQLSLPTWTLRIMRSLLWGLLIIGLTTLILDQVLDNYDNMEDAFEWVMALMIHVYFLCLYSCWRVTGFSASFSIRG